MQENHNDIHENSEKRKPETQKKEYPGLIAIKVEMPDNAHLREDSWGWIPEECVPMPVPVPKKERLSHLRLVKPGEQA